MGVFIVTYDLTYPEDRKDYDDLIKAIEHEFPDHCHFQQSVWMFYSPLTADRIRDILVAHIDTNDKLFVVPIGGNAYVSKAQVKDIDCMNRLIGRERAIRNLYSVL